MKLRLHKLRGRATCCRQHVACIWATCIPLYPATDGQQTGNNFIAATLLLQATGNMLPWCKRGLSRTATRRPVRKSDGERPPRQTSRIALVTLKRKELQPPNLLWE